MVLKISLREKRSLLHIMSSVDSLIIVFFRRKLHPPITQCTLLPHVSESLCKVSPKHVMRSPSSFVLSL